VSAVTAELEPAISDPEKQLAWERRHRPRAAIAALLGSAGLAVFYVLQEVLQRDTPVTSGLQALQRAVQTGPVANLPSLQVSVFEYLDTKVPLVLLIAFGGFLGFVGLAWSVGFLGVAARARQPTLRRFVIYLPIIGGVVLGVSVLMSRVAGVQIVDEFLSGPRTVQAATSADDGAIVFATLLYRLGTVVLAIGLLLVALNAMRTGLLTRMLGYIGIASGAMLVMVPLPIVQIFWLGSLGFVLLGRWPGGDTSAWETGRSVPWPTPERPPSRQRRGVHAPAPRPAGAAPSSARRKRKKRH
jgi:hypothetical protein